MRGTYYKKRNEFSEVHYLLPAQQCLFDIDKVKGEWLNLEINEGKQEAIYVEYTTLRHLNTFAKKFDFNRIRFLAMFELKYVMCDRVQEAMRLNIGSSGWAEFIMAKKLDMRFFYVIATNGESPFTFYEYDLMTGEYKEAEYKLGYEKGNETLKRETLNWYWKDVLKLMK